MKTLRKRLYQDPEIGELARDVDDALQSLVELSKVRFEGVCNLPIYLSLAEQPTAIIAARVQAKDGSAHLSPGFLAFTWESSGRRAKISSMAGVVPGVPYVIDFLVVT